MATRGRPPKPAALKKIAGNPGKRKIIAEPVISRALNAFPPPDFLTPDAVEAWHFVLSQLPESMLRAVDFHELAVFCTAYDVYKNAYKEVKKHGMVIQNTRGDAVENPYLKIMNRQAEIFHRAGSQLGLSPVARTRMAMKDSKSESNSVFAKFGKNVLATSKSMK